eukprot:scaffold9664_cov79-Isochrysis_galbana.AAC.1
MVTNPSEPASALSKQAPSRQQYNRAASTTGHAASGCPAPEINPSSAKVCRSALSASCSPPASAAAVGRTSVRAIKTGSRNGLVVCGGADVSSGGEAVWLAAAGAAGENELPAPDGSDNGLLPAAAGGASSLCCPAHRASTSAAACCRSLRASAIEPPEAASAFESSSACLSQKERTSAGAGAAPPLALGRA